MLVNLVKGVLGKYGNLIVIDGGTAGKLQSLLFQLRK